MPEEKRRHPRFSVEGLQGTMHFASNVEVLNMSMGGVALRADKRLNIGGEYSLKLQTQDKSVLVKGVVVWSVLSGFRKDGNGESVPEYSAGLRFKDVISGAITDILHFIDENKLVNEHRLTGTRFQLEDSDRATVGFPEGFKVKMISLSGMLIETERDLELEGAHYMEISPPGYEPIRFLGRVASHLEVLDEPPEHFEVGIEFLELSPEDARRLKEYVNFLALSQ